MQSFRRRAKNLELLREEVMLTYGPRARIVDATRITRRGLGRFFANEEVEATVEVPEQGASPMGGVSADRIDRAGIAALLADVDLAEGGSSRTPVPPPTASTASPAFAAVLASVERGLGADVSTPASAPAPVQGGMLALEPAPTGASAAASPTTNASHRPPLALAPAPGDFVLFVGLAGDALAASRMIAATHDATADVCTTGSTARLVPGGGVVSGRRDELLQRAASLDRGRAVFVAHAAALDDRFERLAELRPDEVWAVVDASRSLEDTKEWVERLDATTGVHALAVIGATLTRDPAEIGRLGIRIGWSEPESRTRRA
ncbi:MAG TPA: hypothetical protein VI121_12950 [Agromyces sp.]